MQTFWSKTYPVEKVGYKTPLVHKIKQFQELYGLHIWLNVKRNHQYKYI